MFSFRRNLVRRDAKILTLFAGVRNIENRYGIDIDQNFQV